MNTPRRELCATIIALTNESQEHDCIAHGEWSQELEDVFLEGFTEDYVENFNEVEFWGEDADGDWRVHLKKKKEAP